MIDFFLGCIGSFWFRLVSILASCVFLSFFPVFFFFFSFSSLPDSSLSSVFCLVAVYGEVLLDGFVPAAALSLPAGGLAFLCISCCTVHDTYGTVCVRYSTR